MLFKTKKIGLFKIQTKTQQKQDKILENKSQIWTHGRAMFLQYMHYNLIHNMRCFTVFTNRCALVVQEKLLGLYSESPSSHDSNYSFVNMITIKENLLLD